MAAGLAGWSLGRLWSGYQEVVHPGHLPTVTLADVGFLTLPVCALLALLAVATGLPRPTPTSPRRDRVVLVLDSVLVTGSLLALTWSTALGGVTRAGTTTSLALTVALAYPISDLILVTMVVLLITTRPASRPMRRPMLLLGAGLLAFAASDSLHVTRLASGGGPMSALANAGFIIGPGLIAVAALSRPHTGDCPLAARPDADWLHLLLPYVPVIATGVMIAVRTGTGGTLTPFEAYLGWLGLGLVVARQMLTIVDNTVLLARVSEGQQRLHHQAFHDPLTGLANRALFQERLVSALERHRLRGQPLALLFADLDDFKAINDSFGHAVGDRLLHAVGDRLVGCVRRDDVVARLGGDEFAVLIERQPGDAEPVGQRILSALREPFVMDGNAVTVSASVGLVVPDPADAPVRRRPVAPRRRRHVRRQTPRQGHPRPVRPRRRQHRRRRPAAPAGPGPRRRPGDGRLRGVLPADRAASPTASRWPWRRSPGGPIRSPASSTRMCSSPWPNAPDWSRPSTTSSWTVPAPTSPLSPPRTGARSMCTSTSPPPGSASTGSSRRWRGP